MNKNGFPKGKGTLCTISTQEIWYSIKQEIPL